MNSYFVRSGIITPPNTNGTLRYVGFGGWDWSSRGSSTRDDGATFPGSYYFSFSNSVVPSRGPLLACTRRMARLTATTVSPSAA